MVFATHALADIPLELLVLAQLFSSWLLALEELRLVESMKW
jgi:hypothetical protein